MSETVAFLLAVMPVFCVLGVATHAVTQPAKRAVEKRKARDLKVRSNVRKTFPPDSELRALARSVMKRQIHPIIILADGTLLDGECRWRGLMLEAPDHEVDVIVVEHEPSAAEICEMQMISAMHSRSLEPVDEALASKQWLDQHPGATAKELASKIDRDPSYLTRLLALFKCVPAVQKAAIEDRAVSVKAWYQISLLPEAEQGGLLELYLSGLAADQVTAIRKEKQRAATPAAPSQKVSKFKGQLKGLQVQISGAEFDISGLITVLGELKTEAEKAKKDGYDIPALAAILADRAKDKAKKVG